MEDEIPRLRVIAGPNGSGKSTLKSVIGSHRLGVYLNADETEAQLLGSFGLDLAKLMQGIDGSSMKGRLRGSQILATEERQRAVDSLECRGTLLFLPPTPFASYLASAVLEILRNDLIQLGVSLTLETVMSHRSKVELLCDSKELGYRTYLYYIATESPEINIRRVISRVATGGHSVPPQKVRERYARSLDLLPDAIQCSSRAYIFDNSSDDLNPAWLAEFYEGSTYEYKVPDLPKWFSEAVDQYLA